MLDKEPFPPAVFPPSTRKTERGDEHRNMPYAGDICSVAGWTFFFFSPEHLTLAAKGLLHMGPSV